MDNKISKKIFVILATILVFEPIITLLFNILKYKTEKMSMLWTFGILEAINIIIFISVLKLKKYPKLFAGLIAIYVIGITFLSTYNISFTRIILEEEHLNVYYKEIEYERVEKNIYGITIKDNISE